MVKSGESIYIVMPAYNEEENIEAVVNEWYPILKYGNSDSRLIIADSGSLDKTHEILVKLQKKYRQLKIVSNSDKQHGPKLMYLYKMAINNKIDWIFQTDSDGQTNPHEFKFFWNDRGQYDILLGNRIIRGDGWQRACVEKVVCWLLKIYFNVSVPDANAPFRLMRTSIVSKYIDNFEIDYNLPNIMLTTYFVYNSEKLIFKEISFKSRQGGVNSVNIPKIIKIGLNAIKDFRFFKKNMK